MSVTSAPIPAGSPREMARGARLACVGLAWLSMLRWVLLLLMGFGLVKGVESGWVELHWQRLLHDVGIPFVPDPENPAPQGQQT